MNIDDLYTADAHEEGAEMQVCDQLGKKLELFITLAGQDSEIWVKATREKQQRSLQRLVGKVDDKIDYDLEDMVNASLSWRGFEQDGKELKFSKDAVRELYKKAPYIQDQAVLFINNRVNFIKS